MGSIKKLELLVVRRQHMRRVRDFKIIAGEHVATHHKPLFCVMHIQNGRADNTVGERSSNGGNAVGTQPLHTNGG